MDKSSNCDFYFIYFMRVFINLYYLRLRFESCGLFPTAKIRFSWHGSLLRNIILPRLLLLVVKITWLAHSFCKIYSRSVWTLWNSIPSSLFFDYFSFLVQYIQILKLLAISNRKEKLLSFVLIKRLK
jgi:hypothetical protein